MTRRTFIGLIGGTIVAAKGAWPPPSLHLTVPPETVWLQSLTLLAARSRGVVTVGRDGDPLWQFAVAGHTAIVVTLRRGEEIRLRDAQALTVDGADVESWSVVVRRGEYLHAYGGAFEGLLTP